MAALELDWYAADLRTGLIVEELRSLAPGGPLSARMGQSSSLQADLTVAGAPRGWIAATEPGRTMAVAVDRLTQQPLWPGMVLSQTRGSASTAQLALATPEAYFDRRYTGGYTGTGQDEAVILTGTGSALLVQAPCFVFDTLATGSVMDYSVADADDRTVLSTWQELAGLDSGPEWTVGVEWADNTFTGFVLPIRIRSRLGVQSAVPQVVFDFPGCVSSYSQTLSYEAGKGATQVMAWGDGQGADRLHSDVYTATDLETAGWPRYTYRFTPAAGLTDPDQLNRHAASELAQLRGGTSSWTVTATASVAPRLGLDWGLGDSLRLLVAGPGPGEDTGPSPGHPAGADIVARAYGWDLDAAADTIAPILLED